MAIIPFPGRETHGHLLERYDRLRARLRAFHREIVNSLTRPELRAGARDLHMLSGKRIALQSDTEYDVLLDYCIYNRRTRGKTAAQRFAGKPRAPSFADDDKDILRAMASARYRLLRVLSVEHDVGVDADDLLSVRRLFLIDRGLASSTKQGSFLAGNVIDFGEFCMTTGGFLPIRPDFVADMEAAWQIPLRTVARVTGEDVPADPEEDAALAKEIINVALNDGGAEEVTYVDPPCAKRDTRKK